MGTHPGESGEGPCPIGPEFEERGEDIEISVDPKPDGTHIHLVITPRLGTLQLIDWGEDLKFQREILDSLDALRISNA
jgi:hypothetical protein